MSNVTIKLEGISSTVRRLDSLDKKVRKSIVRKAVRAGGNPLVKALRQNAPIETKALRKASTQKVQAYARSGVTMAIVGAKNRKDAATGRNPAKYIHLVERGTKPHTIWGPVALPNGSVREFVRHPGVRARRYVEKSAKQADRQAVSAFTQKMKQEVDNTVAAMGAT